MNEDELLGTLGRLAREQPEALDEGWERLAAGALTAEEESELRSLAGSSEPASEAYEAFRPLGPDFQAGVVQAIRQQAAMPAAKPLRFARRTARLAAWSVGSAAAAAALVVVLLRPSPLPDYALVEISGGSRASRGEAAGPPDLSPGDRFEVTLRPATEVNRANSLRAHAFLLRGPELRPVDVQSRLDPRGSVKLQCALDPGLPAGVWTLWTVVGRRGALPGVSELRSLSARAAVRGRDWVAIPTILDIRPRAPL